MPPFIAIDTETGGTRPGRHDWLPIRHAWRCSMDKLGTLMDRGIIPPGKANLARLGELAGLWLPRQRPAVHEAAADARACLEGYEWLLKKEKEAGDTVLHLYTASLSERRRLEALILEVSDYHNGTAAAAEVSRILRLVEEATKPIRAEIEKEKEGQPSA